MSNASTLSHFPGHQLGRYQLITTLGQGGMGTIHLAVAAGLGEFQKLCVVKELRRDLSNNKQFVEMFLQEAKLAARLNHANVVNTLEAAKVDDRFFLSMEFLDGQPLSEVMRRDEDHPRRPLQLRLQILCDVLAGLHYAHELRDYSGKALSIVHRDVSPQNVFITYDGTVKVVDFGIAKAADAGVDSNSGLFRGKLAYAAPEQLLGQPVDRRTDIFAVGVMLWEAIALRRFTPPGPIGQEVIERRAAGGEPPISTVVPSVDPVLAAICDRALSKNPQERYSNAEEFRSALAAYASTLGPWIEPAGLGRFMETKFATERMAMQQLIRTHLREDGVQSTVRPVQSPLHFTETHPDEATAVADLSELVDVTRVSIPVPTLRRSRKPMFLIGLGCSALGAIAALTFGPSAPQEAPPAPAKSATAPTQAVSPSAPALPVPKPALRPEGHAATDANTQRTGPTRVEAAPPTGIAPPAVAAAAPEQAAATPTAELPAEEPPLTNAAKPPVPRPQRLRRPTAVSHRAPARVQAAEEAAAPEASNLPSATATDQVDGNMGFGANLKRAPRAPRRSLDMESPFE